MDEGAFPMAAADRGHLHGLGLFETLLGLEGRAVFAERHLARLGSACERLGWRVELGEAGAAMGELLVRNGLDAGRARIRLAVSGGEGTPGNLARGARGVVWMMAGKVAEPVHSVRVAISKWLRNERSPLAGLKCASYAENVVALDAARRAGFDETLFFNGAGQLCEAAMANVFLVSGGVLRTPDPASGCLPGVTRGVVLECAEDLGIPAREEALRMGDLEAADEVFLTSATRGPVGVAEVDGREFGEGAVTAELRRAWTARLG